MRISTFSRDLLSVAFVLLAFAVSTTGQIAAPPPPVPKKITKGIVNGGAVSLPAPKYPAAAREVGASGTVSVEVVIGTNGKVISAEAIAGHPLLRSVSEEAAMNSVFRPTLLSGQPVEVSGIILYNFMPPAKRWNGLETGYIVEYTHLTGSQPFYNAFFLLAYSLDTGWDLEKEIANSGATYFRRREERETIAKRPPVDGVSFAGSVGRFTIAPENSEEPENAIRIDDERKIFRPYYEESLEQILTDFDSVLSKRLSDSALWEYKVGKAAGRILAAISQDGPSYESGIRDMDELMNEKPVGAPQEVANSLGRIVSIFEDGSISDETRKSTIKALCMVLVK